ncbi:MAG TPA: tetratricopeptide repeat protein, partial [Verrucomicrobiales bacterium]|nr:tetratricopeptide repeat protein [Verrucomicrobiales bacterium]
MHTFPVLLSRLVAACLLAGFAAGCSKKPGAANYEESAKKYFEKGELEKAKIEYMNLLRVDKANATAMRRLGQIWMAQGGPLRAMPYLQEAVKLVPADAPLRKQLMDAWIELGGVQEARDEAVEILKIAPDNGEALIVLAESAVDEEEFTAARDSIAKFPAKDSAAIHVAEASLCLQQDNKAGAKEALAKAVALEPKSTAAMLVAGNLLLKDNDVAGAEAKFKELAEASPARSLHRLRYAEYVSRHQSSEAKKQASELVEKLVSEAPDYLPALTLSAQLTLARQKAREGIAILEKVFAIDNGNPPARMVQARLWMALGEPQKAIEGLEGMLLHNPENLSAKFQLALACVQNANTAKAMLVLETILKDNPGFGDALLLLAELNLRSGEPEAVVSLVTALLKERPGHPLAAYLLAGAYQALKKTDEAAKLMEEMVKANPKDPRPRFRLGEIYRFAGRVADARSVFEQALTIFPG